MEANNINTKGQAIIAAIEAGFAAGGRDEWDAPEFEAARQATADAGCCWDFAGWRDAADCVRGGMLGGVRFTPMPDTWYSTDADTIYVDSNGRIWLVASQDWHGDRAPERLSALPDGAEEFDATEDWQIEIAAEMNEEGK